jgi:hypothetical protein
VLYLDRARYYGSPVVKDWLRRHPEFELEPLPPYSPNLNLIERLWKFLRQRALSRWHKTFEAMQAAVAEVVDHLSDYRKELNTLMNEHFHIVAKAAVLTPLPSRRTRSVPSGRPGKPGVGRGCCRCAPGRRVRCGGNG